jgi:AcrR family transcriptional regulator
MPDAPDDTEGRLLEAAGEIFADEGFKAATVRKIVERAGVGNIAAINYYFGDKEQLYCAAVKRAFHGRSAPDALPAWPPNATPAVKLRTFMKDFAVKMIGDHGPVWHLRLMARELTQPSAGCAAFVRDFARPHFELLCGLLCEVFPQGTPAATLHLTALSIIGQVIHHRCGRAIIAQMVGPEEFATYDADRIADHIADFSLAALGLSRSAARGKKS